MSYTETKPETDGVASLNALEKAMIAVRAAEEKKALDITLLKLIEVTSFTDYFVICSGNSSRQVQAIADEIEDLLKKSHVRPLNIEGYQNAEWILMDYGSMVVHIFSQDTRKFYDLERLWRDAEKVELAGTQE